MIVSLYSTIAAWIAEKNLEIEQEWRRKHDQAQGIGGAVAPFGGILAAAAPVLAPVLSNLVLPLATKLITDVLAPGSGKAAAAYAAPAPKKKRS